jgi:hypothetical protein
MCCCNGLEGDPPDVGKRSQSDDDKKLILNFSNPDKEKKQK